jgi:hypothetical protein
MRRESAAEKSFSSEQLEKIARDARTFESLRRPDARKIRRPICEDRQTRKRASLLPIIVQIGNRKWRAVAFRPCVIHPHQALWIRERKRSEQGRVDKTEH